MMKDENIWECVTTLSGDPNFPGKFHILNKGGRDRFKAWDNGMYFYDTGRGYGGVLGQQTEHALTLPTGSPAHHKRRLFIARRP